MRTVNVVIIIFLSAFHYSCFYYADPDYAKYRGHNKALDSLFVSAYSAYEKGDFDTALKKFNVIRYVDTSFNHYESYAFSSQCLYHKGYPQLGAALLDTALKNIKMKYPDIESDTNHVVKDLRQMKKDYPDIPWFLKKEFGFEPFNTGPTVHMNRAYGLNEQVTKLWGDVIVKVRLNELGKPLNPTIIQSVNVILDSAAIKIIDQWVFTPFKQKGRGRPIELRLHVPFPYK